MSFPIFKVGELADQIRGVSYNKDDASDTMKPGFLPVLRAGNITEFGLVYDDLVYVPQERISENQKIRKGDVILAASSGSLEVVGKAAPALSDYEGGFGAFCKLLRPNKKVDPRYFAQFFKTKQYRKRVSALAAGANINNLKNEHLDEMPIPLPSLPEQRRIAEILDRIDSLRAQRRDAIENISALVHSTFLDMFGNPIENPKEWPRMPFRDLLEKIESGWSPTCEDRAANADEWGVLKLGAVTSCEFLSSENKALPASLRPDPSIEVKAGDILFSRKNTYELVAACAYVRDTRPRLMMSDLIFRFVLKSDSAVLPIYLQQLLVNPSKRREVQKLAGGSSGSMPNISKAKLETLPIEVPNMSLQIKFRQRIESLIQLRNSNFRSKVTSDEFFDSVQQRAFKGEL